MHHTVCDTDGCKPATLPSLQQMYQVSDSFVITYEYGCDNTLSCVCVCVCLCSNFLKALTQKVHSWCTGTS